MIGHTHTDTISTETASRRPGVTDSEDDRGVVGSAGGTGVATEVYCHG
ncbi:hypothetical protein [Natronolimnobius baerhuensis]|nr:hypothetical protein [Natronolimnobius baerhuensis]